MIIGLGHFLYHFLPCRIRGTLFFIYSPLVNLSITSYWSETTSAKDGQPTPSLNNLPAIWKLECCHNQESSQRLIERWEGPRVLPNRNKKNNFAAVSSFLLVSQSTLILSRMTLLLNIPADSIYIRNWRRPNRMNIWPSKSMLQKDQMIWVLKLLMKDGDQDKETRSRIYWPM